jgi:Uma2 family endonuclease
MSAILETSLQSESEAIERLVVPANWETYERFLVARGADYPRLRINYVDGRLELTTVSSLHDRIKYLLGRIIDTVTEELGLEVVGQGETTIRRRDLDRGFEPDAWYYIQNAARMREVRELNFEVDPPPDLAIEIEISRSLTDRIALYSSIGVREIWRFDGESLRILHLLPDRSYVERPMSLAIPALAGAEVIRVLSEAESADTTTVFRNFRLWVRQALLPK